jgi:hypothetical protein
LLNLFIKQIEFNPSIFDIHHAKAWFDIRGYKPLNLEPLNDYFFYLSTSATFLLYQFIKAEVERLKQRYTIIIIATPSMACPV